MLSFSAYAQEQKAPAAKYAVQNDLIGYWKKVEVPTAIINEVNPWPQKFQWFAFYESGKMYSFMSDTKFDLSVRELHEIFMALPDKSCPTYEISGKFLFVTNESIQDYSETWGIKLLTRDVNSYLKDGNIIMTLDDGEGNAIYARILQRID
jgi:hypothetical protein